MEVVEDERYTREYLEEDKRSIANAIQVFFSDGSSTDQVAVEYPIGHRRRRKDGIPLLKDKFRNNLASRFPGQQCEHISSLCRNHKTLEQTAVQAFIGLFQI
jgi:2-methylcitrate dehydratase